MYICGFGLNHQYYQNSFELKETVATNNIVKQEVTECENRPRLVDKNCIGREDRAVLNDISIISVNSLMDLINKSNEGEERETIKAILSKSSVFTACDGPDVTGEIDNTQKILNLQGSNFWQNICELGRFSNPLDVLRLLTTNSLYHISKIMQTHEEGFPVQTASISSLVALDMANLYSSICEDFDFSIVSTASDMTNVEYKPFWMKIGKVKTDSNSDGIIPSWGGASILCSKQKIGNLCLGEILVSKILYRPRKIFLDVDWDELLLNVVMSNIKPDVFVSYDNGVYTQGKAETDAIKKYYPDSSIINYKNILGYTGKSNTILDICCSLLDADIKSGQTICINAAGLNYGLGFVIIRKS